MLMSKFGCLYIVAVPIGNFQDITLRAVELLRTVDAVICEELREGSTLLKKLGIQNELICLNEHNEEEQSIVLVQKLQNGQSLALISDCGTPVFADPGYRLVELLVGVGIKVVPVPGPSSLMALLSVVDFKLEKFIYGGFLSREEDRRRQDLVRLRAAGMPVVLMDAPYRMGRLLEEVSHAFGENTWVILGCDLTLPSEMIYRGSAGDLAKRLAGKKAEFVLLIHPLTPHKTVRS
jgi:16S rRNA (cytidine1402-2'-O)-methyltransferase